MKFNYGISIGGIRYGWNKKELYRLPFNKGTKSFSLRKLKEIDIGRKTGYLLDQKKYTLSQLEEITNLVDWEVNRLKSPDCPF